MGRLLKNLLISYNEQFSHVTQYYIKVYIDNLLHAIRKLLRAQETLRLWGRVYFKVLEMLFYRTH